MNSFSYYDRQKEPWEEKECQSIRNRYEKKEMNVSQIADIHRRTPGSISHKLKNLGIINIYTEARGYLEYKNSDLYKEIVNKNKNPENPRNIKKDTKIISNNEPDIIQIKNDINEIKESINKLFKLLEPKNLYNNKYNRMSQEYDNIKDELTRQITAQKIIYKFRNFLYSINKDIRQQFFRISREFFDNEYQNNITLTATERERVRLLLTHWDWNRFDTNARDWWFSLSFNHSNSWTLMTLINIWTDDVQVFDSDNFETATDGVR